METSIADVRPNSSRYRFFGRMSRGFASRNSSYISIALKSSAKVAGTVSLLGAAVKSPQTQQGPGCTNRPTENVFL